MLSARTFNLLANVSLTAGIFSLGISASLEFSRWTRGEARESVSAMRDYNEENAPEIMPARFSISNGLTEGEAVVRAEDSAQPIRVASLNNMSVIAGAARIAAAPKEAKLAALPAKAGILFEELGRKVCIGGTMCEEHCRVEADGCETRPTYTIRLERSVFISAVQLYAHDQVGPTRRASLLVKVNGEAIGKTEVYRYGSTVTVKVGRVGQLVSVESMHAIHGFQSGGEEAVIWDVYVMGREPR